VSSASSPTRRGDFIQALGFADSALSLGRGLRGSTVIWVSALRARALARLANHDETRRAISAVERARDAYEPDDLDRIGGLFEFTAPKQSYYIAGALADVSGTAHEAEREALQALTYYSGNASYYATEAGARCELALARAQMGEYEGALEALDPLFDLPPGPAGLWRHRQSHTSPSGR
jgi:tetratricopeptide (TPR) repeat protein